MVEILIEFEKQLNQKEKVRHSTLIRQLRFELEQARRQVKARPIQRNTHSGQEVTDNWSGDLKRLAQSKKQQHN